MTAAEGSSLPDGNGREEVDLLAEQFLSRRRQGERPTIEEYASRRPDLAAEIRAIFPTLLLIEELGKEPSDSPLPAPATGRPGADSTPGLEQVGEYRVLREIGRGGMGIVYEAVQESLGRRVAIKVLPHHSLLGTKHLERFRQEARAAARLSHPNIVPVFGVGEHLGLHYFVMQYIPGQGLDAVVEEVRRLRKSGKALADSSVTSGLGTGGQQRYHHNVARIVRDAALALDHAHREGILHRDVKPSNLLLDPKGHIWLADFGLAKSEGSDDLTHSGDFVGTFRYMAPERFKGWSDPRSDVYSLGLTLYELLALRPAFVESDRGRLLRKVASEEPPALRRFDRSLPRDLETIVLKAIAKETAQRYATAQDLAQDLDRYLRGEPVMARRSTAMVRIVRWGVRNPVLAVLGSTVLLLLLAVAVISSRAAVELKEERDQGREQLRISYVTQARILRGSRQPGQRFDALDALIAAAKLGHGPELCDEAVAALALDDVRLVKSWTKNPEDEACFDGDLQRVALSSQNGEVVVRATADDRELVRLPGPGYPVPYVGLLFHPDGRHLAVLFHKSNVFDRWTIWDLERKAAVARVDDGAETWRIYFDPADGSALVPTRGGTLRTIEIPSGRTLREQRLPSNMCRVAIHPGGELVALASTTSTGCHLFERRSGSILRTYQHDGNPAFAAWDPHGRFLAVACKDFRVYLWDAETGALRWSEKRHEAEVVRTLFHPRGNFLLTGSWDNKIRAWDTWSGREILALPRQELYLSKDGNSLGTVSRHGHDLLEVAPAPAGFTLHGHEKLDAKQPLMVALAPGGRLAASCGLDGVSVWDLISRKEVAHLSVGQVLSVEFEAGGDHLITSGDSGLLRWPIRSRLAGGRRRTVLGPPAMVSSIEGLWRHTSGKGGQQVAFIHGRTHGHVVSLAEPGERARLEDLSPLEHLAYSPDGRWIAGTSQALNQVVVWDGASGKRTNTLDTPFGLIAFDPQGQHLVVGTCSDYLFLRVSNWEVARRLPRAPGLSFPGPVAFDRRGQVMAVAHTDSRIWLVEPESLNQITELEAPDPRILTSLALDLEAGFLAGSTRSQRCHFWDLRSLERQLAQTGLPWKLQCPGDGPGREPIQVDAVFGGAILGHTEALEDSRAPPLLRQHWHSLFLPGLEGHGDVDTALAAPIFLVPERIGWKYFRGLLEPAAGLEWTANEFDDATWPRGESGFSGSRVGDSETGTLLDGQMGSFTTLYLRHEFHLESLQGVKRLLLALRFEDGFVAYLNGKEVARQNVPAGRITHNALAAGVRYPARKDYLASIETSLLVSGKNVIAIQGLVHNRSSPVFLSPVLAAVLAPDVERDSQRTANLMKGLDGAPDLALAAYRTGRVLQRAGKLEEALVEFARAISLDPASPEPVVRSIECRRQLGDPGAAEALARAAIERGGLLDDGVIWAQWSLAAFGDLRRPLAEALATWPDSQALPSRHGAELRSSIEDLERHGAVRINCGGDSITTKDGMIWSSDRFFLGGARAPEERPLAKPQPILGADEPRIYRSVRSFPGDRQLRPAYRVPVPAGQYVVDLHFAEVDSRTLVSGRAFGIQLEQTIVVESYEPRRVLLATAQVQSFQIEVRDGFLDLDFLAGRGTPIISAIAIQRPNQADTQE